MTIDSKQETPLDLKPHRGADIQALFITATVSYGITLITPLFPALIISCIVLILLSRLRNRLNQPLLWWSGIGLCSGSFLGTASSMVNNVQQHGATPANTALERLLFLVVLGITGFFQALGSASILMPLKDDPSETYSAHSAEHLQAFSVSWLLSPSSWAA